MRTRAFPRSRTMAPRSRTWLLMWAALGLAALLLISYVVIDSIAVMRLTTPTRYPLGDDPAS